MSVVTVLQGGQAYMIERSSVEKILKAAMGGQAGGALDALAAGAYGPSIGDGFADLNNLTPVRAGELLASLYATETTGLVPLIAAA